MKAAAVTSTANAIPLEVAEFLNVLDSCSPSALTWCPARTARYLAAHVAGNYREITRHIEAYLSGSPLIRTRAFDEREPEFRLMSSPELVSSIAAGEERMRLRIAELLEREADPVLRWTNRQVHAVGFLKHSRSECAIHRWDLAGDDEVSEKLLSQHELLAHAVTFIGPLPMTARGMATGAGAGRALRARVRSQGQPDLLITVHRGQPELFLTEPEGEALVEGDPAARLLFLWGRRPTPFSRLTCNGPAEELSRLQWLLSGY